MEWQSASTIYNYNTIQDVTRLASSASTSEEGATQLHIFTLITSVSIFWGKLQFLKMVDR